MRENPKPFEIYRHFKGNLYQVLTIAKDSETMEDVVVYQALYGDYVVYARPLVMFMSEVDKEKYPAVKAVYRFEKEGGQNIASKSVSPTEEKDKNIDQQMHSKGMVEDTETKKYENMHLQEKKEQPAMSMQQDEADIDPVVLEFLDAETYEEKLRILVPLRETITDEMLTTMAIATDVEVGEGSTNERYEQLKKCLLTFQKYECDRLR